MVCHLLLRPGRCVDCVQRQPAGRDRRRHRKFLDHLGRGVGAESRVPQSPASGSASCRTGCVQKTEGRQEPQESGSCSACLARWREEFAARTSSPSSFEVVPSLRSDCCGKPPHQGDVAEPQTQSCDCGCRMGRLSGNPAMQGFICQGGGGIRDRCVPGVQMCDLPICCREMFATTPTCLLLRFGAASRRPCGKEHPCPGPDWASRTKCGC